MKDRSRSAAKHAAAREEYAPGKTFCRTIRGNYGAAARSSRIEMDNHAERLIVDSSCEAASTQRFTASTLLRTSAANP